MDRNASLCGGDSIRLRALVAGGTPPLRYSWTPAAGLDDPTRFDPMAHPAATTVYVLTVTDAAGCTASRVVRVGVTLAPAVPTVAMRGDSLLASPAWSYQWEREGAAIPGATGRTVYPADGGWYRVAVTDTNGCVSRSQPFPFGVCAVSIEADAAAPGDRAPVRLRLQSSSHLAVAGARSFSTTVRVGAALLTPIEATPVGTIVDSSRVISTSGIFTDGSDLLIELPFRAMLGDRDRVPLAIDTLRWNVPNIRVTLADGAFHLRICREGGDRLFSSTAPLRLAQNHPNPFNAETILEFTTVEDGPVELAVFDRLGRRVATAYRGPLTAGSHHVAFDASALPSGCYLLALRTASQTATRAIQVVK
jgi:hypothetical protein